MSAESVGMCGVAIAIIGGILALLLTIIAIAKRYKTVPPNMAMIVYGRKYKEGFKIISGGGKFIIPIIERFKFLSLAVRKISFKTTATTEDMVTVTVACTLNAKIGGDEEMIRRAAERFLDIGEDEIDDVIRETAEGSTRAIIGTLTIEKIIREREAFAAKVIDYAGKDLSPLGLTIDVFNIKEVEDKEVGEGPSYLEAYEQKRVAQVVSDSRKQQAVADSEARQVEAQQDLVATETEMDAKEGIAEAEKDLLVARAKFRADAETEARKADQAGPFARAVAEQEVAGAERELAGIRAEETEARLDYEVVKPADAKAKATITTAEGDKGAAIRRAEGEAAQIQKTKEAAAAGEKAYLLAQAEGEAAKTEKQLLAEAKGTREKLLAEAQGKAELAEALKKLDQQGVLLLILAQLPEIIEGIPPIAKAINEPIGNIKNITMIAGGNGPDGSRTLGNLVSELPKAFLKLGVEGGAVLMSLLKTKEGQEFLKVLSDTTGLESLRKIRADAEAPASEDTPTKKAK
jgi:flotillin